MSGQTYKLVSWVNHNYLKEIQCGIQTAHSSKVIEKTSWKSKPYKEWSENDVIVILQGGGHKFLTALHDVLEQVAFAYQTVYSEALPIGIFYEPELNFAATSVSGIFADKHREIFRNSYSTIEGIKADFSELNTEASYIHSMRVCSNADSDINVASLFNFLVRFSYWMDSCKTV